MLVFCVWAVSLLKVDVKGGGYKKQISSVRGGRSVAGEEVCSGRGWGEAFTVFGRDWTDVELGRRWERQVRIGDGLDGTDPMIPCTRVCAGGVCVCAGDLPRFF